MSTTSQAFGYLDEPITVSESDLESTPIMDILAGIEGAVKAIDIDNSANAAASYFKGYDNAAPTIGTTAPDLVIMIPASVRRTIVFIDGFDFSNFSFACVTTGGTGGTTNPTSSVIAEVIAA